MKRAIHPEAKVTQRLDAEYSEMKARREASARYIASCTAQIEKLPDAAYGSEILVDKLNEVIERVNWLLEQ